MQIQFIACGKMGEAFLKGFLKIWIKQNQISILEAYIPRIKELKQNYPDINMNVNIDADVVILAIKPQQLHEINFSDFKQNPTILSMLAWSSTNTIQQYSKLENIIRCMPNLPLSIWQWAWWYFISWNPHTDHKNLIQKLFSQLGYFIQTNDEDTIDKITAISWSWPAYFLYFTQLLQQQAENLWFSANEAKNLAENTFIWTANLLKFSWLSAQQLKENVTSKWWTTEAALQVFEKEWLWKIINNASDSAYQKAKDLNSLSN